MLNRLNTLLWSSNRKLDHRSSLIQESASRESGRREKIIYLVRVELEHVLLIGNKSALLHREVTISLGLDERELPELEVHIVVLRKEVID